MSKKKLYALTLAFVLLAMNVSLVFAAQPLAIHIEVTEIIAGGTEPFIASGAAISTGLVCPTGTVVETAAKSKDTNGPYTKLWITKHFDCDDGSGTFDVDMVVKLKKATGETTANWKVVAGTGNYASLKGNGKLVGTPVTLGVIFDVYDGKLH
jgi:hypothetical protein